MIKYCKDDKKLLRYIAKRNEIFKRITILILVTVFILNNPWYGEPIVAKASQVTVTVDYNSETMNVKSALSTKFYISTDQKTWEMIEGSDIDISTFLTTKDVLLYVKGNKDIDQISITLPARNSNLKPVYRVVAGVGRIEFTSATAVQYRNGSDGMWYNAVSPMSTVLYEFKGTTLFFRTAPTPSSPAGKLVTVKVPKRPTAPSAKLDAGKLSITGIKSGETQYRVGDNPIWNTYTSTNGSNYIDISSLLGGSTILNTAIPAGIIELRTIGDDKKVASAVKIIEVPAQITLAASAATLNGSTLMINDNDTTKAYEYTVVTKGMPLDYSTARWTGITSKRNVIISKVNVQDRVLVRLKSITDKTTKQVSLPSTYIEFAVTSLTQK